MIKLRREFLDVEPFVIGRNRMDEQQKRDERKLLVMDLDGTICEQTYNNTYKSAAPRLDVIAKMQKLYDEGWHITIFTARGMRTYKNDVNMIERQYRQMTEDWLLRYQVPYHRLLFGKPPGDRYVDDRGMTPEELVDEP